MTVTPGGTATVSVFEPTINVTVKKSGGAAQSGARVVISPTVSGCAVTPPPLTTPSNGVVSVSLPYGTYSICAQDKVNVPTRRVVRSPSDNKSRSSSSYTLTLPSVTTSPAACP